MWHLSVIFVGLLDNTAVVLPCNYQSQTTPAVQNRLVLGSAALVVTDIHFITVVVIRYY